MKIVEIRAMRLTLPESTVDRSGRRPSWAETAEVANPMSRYPHVKRIAACGCRSGTRSGAR